MKIRFLSMVVLLTIISLSQAADFRFIDGAVDDHSWAAAANWNPSGPPAAADIAYLDEDYSLTGKYLLISEGDNITVARIRMSETAAGKNVYARMDGGTLNVTAGIDLGYFHFYDNTFAACTFEQNGGNVVVGDFWRVGFRTGLSKWILRGGTVTCNRVIFQTTTPSTAQNYSRVEIGGGTISVLNNVAATMQSFFGGVMVPLDGIGTLVAEYSAATNRTTVRNTAYGPAASTPTPANNSTGISASAVLSWLPGQGSVSNDVYFGTDYDAVIAAGKTSPEYIGNITQTQYTPTVLEYGRTYSWRVDAVAADDSVVRGTTWRFTVANNILIDDFQSYTDTTSLQAAWAGVATLDMGSVYGSTQAMRLFFEHTSPAQKTSVTRTFSPAMDWDEPGLMALAVNCYGDANEITTLFVKVSDGTNNATVTYPNVTELYKNFNQFYRTWNIDLADITGGVNLGNITSMEIGFSGIGRGAVMFDDIKLFAARCVPAFFPGDITGDCTTNATDLAIYIRDWLSDTVDVTAEPLATAPVLHYAFDESSGYLVTDSSVNGFHGTTTDFFGHWLPTEGVNGGCLNMDGASGVAVPVSVFAMIDTQMTIAFWINGDAAEYPGRYSFPFVATHNSGDRIMLNIPYKDSDVYWRTHLNPGPTNTAVWYDSVKSDWAGQWTHYAFTKNTVTGVMAIFRNGEMVRKTYGNNRKIADVAPVTNCFVGCLTAAGTYAHKGKMDDFMMFNIELSQEEILTLANKTQMTQPSLSPADVNGDGIVNMGDFSMMANQWLNEQTTWPY